MSWVAIVHEQADFRLANALRRELEQGGVACWFAPRDLVAVAGTRDGHTNVLREAPVVAVVVPVGDRTADALVLEGLASARHGASVVPIFADVDPDGPANGAFAVALGRVRAAVAALAPAPRPDSAAWMLPTPPRAGGLASSVIAVSIAALLALGILACWSRLPTVAATLARHLKSLPAPPTLVATAPGLPMRLLPSHGSEGWHMFVQLREKARRIEYRLDRRGEFVATGQARDPSDLDEIEPMAQPYFELGHLTRPTTIEVRYVDGHGVQKGPFPVHFDPNAEAIREAKYDLGSPRASWIIAAEVSGKPSVHFESLLSHKDAIRSIHYGVDTPHPDRNVHFTQDIRNRWVEGDLTYTMLPAGSRSISIEVEFKDGSRMFREFSLKELMDK